MPRWRQLKKYNKLISSVLYCCYIIAQEKQEGAGSTVPPVLLSFNLQSPFTMRPSGGRALDRAPLRTTPSYDTNTFKLQYFCFCYETDGAAVDALRRSENSIKIVGNLVVSDFMSNFVNIILRNVIVEYKA